MRYSAGLTDRRAGGVWTICDPSTVMKESWKLAWLRGAIIVLAALASYHNSLSGAFVFDDPSRIQDNPRTQHALLTEVVGGTERPVVQLSLALNYAVGGFNVRGYHVFNLIVHALAALTLYGIVRRTLLGKRLRSKYDQVAGWLAFAVALLWLLHPLQTESVTYVIQRAESMMGLFYLLTFYCVIRGSEVAKERLWYAAAVIACALGMGCKPVMATAPVMVLLYDRAFLTGSFREALRCRAWLYSGLAATWLLLLVLLDRGGQDWKTSAGFTYQPIQPMEYALTQPGVILHYLRLSVWPHPLCLDYAWPIARTWTSIVPPVILIAIMLFITVWFYRVMPPLGFACTWFFLTLAPSSSVIPIADVAFEHRMYLSLAAIVTLGVVGIYRLIGQRSVIVLAAFAMALGFLTAQRNMDYRSELAIWSDTVAKRPNNPRAHNNLGFALANRGKATDAIREYECALRLKSDYAEAHNNLGVVLASQGKVSEAITEYAAALRIKPDDAGAHNNLGVALVDQGNVTDAIWQYKCALRLKPDDAEARNNLGSAFFNQGRVVEAIAEYTTALRIKPDFTEAHNNLGLALASQGKVSEAIIEHTAALRLKPDYAEAHNNLGVALIGQGRLAEAIAEFTAAVRLKPYDAEAHNNLGFVLAGQGLVSEAIAEFTAAVRFKPYDADARNNLGSALSSQGRIAEAITEYREALRLKPDLPQALSALAWILAVDRNANLRSAGEAVQLGERLCTLTGFQGAEDLDVLAAAYAEAGRFSDAIRVAQKAIELANAAGQRELAGQVQERLKLYQAGRPFHEGPAAQTPPS